ncbi:DUF5324 family protein [Streptomyces sp. NPDC001744]|uniref:DUF5324 family protein n=1 Tax=Streptomyces sp. NPDC001744 TaxID=3364606 RepID=UPI0036B22123
MTRMDSVRAATGSAKESVLHAADAVAPYAETARDHATHYAHEARELLAPTLTKAAKQAKSQYASHVAPRVPPRVDAAAQRAAVKTRQVARQAAEYTAPRIESAVAATGPALEEAGARSTAAWAALRGQVTPKEIQKLLKKQRRRARAGRFAKGLAVAGVLAGGVFAAWKWWDKQSNPDWLIEPPAPTEVEESGVLTSVDGSVSVLDPEVEAKETEAAADAAAAEAAAAEIAEAEAAERDKDR